MSNNLWSKQLDPRILLALVLLFACVQNLLLWRFLNIADLLSYIFAGLIIFVPAFYVMRPTATAKWRGPTVRVLLVVGIVSFLLYLLGGQGSLFYANADWQVRNAVLRDLVVNPWPFVYETQESPEILRAPLGMYLIPSLVGKAFGLIASDIALLVQNSLLLTMLLGLGSTLFANARGQAIGLAIFILFSGMDILGQLAKSVQYHESLPGHLERWAIVQYSSHITQAFWVPQHALAGWFNALLFLLWRDQRISLGLMYAFIPLLMLLSPLGSIGILPFAIYAGVVTLSRRALKPSDFLLVAAALFISVPAVLYLTAAGSSVGFRVLSPPIQNYLLFEIIEVLPYILGTMALGALSPARRGTFILVTLCLLVFPWVQVGEQVDFTMRVSIAALAILSVEVARVIVEKRPGLDNRPARILLIGTLLVGSVTGALEVVRAVAYGPPPRVRCSLMTIWDNIVELPIVNRSIYFAPIDAVPTPIRPLSVAMVRPEAEPIACWDGPWRVKRFGKSVGDGNSLTDMLSGPTLHR